MTTTKVQHEVYASKVYTIEVYTSDSYTTAAVDVGGLTLADLTTLGELEKLVDAARGLGASRLAIWRGAEHVQVLDL